MIYLGDRQTKRPRSTGCQPVIVEKKQASSLCYGRGHDRSAWSLALANSELLAGHCPVAVFVESFESLFEF